MNRREREIYFEWVIIIVRLKRRVTIICRHWPSVMNMYRLCLNADGILQLNFTLITIIIVEKHTLCVTHMWLDFFFIIIIFWTRILMGMHRLLRTELFKTGTTKQGPNSGRGAICQHGGGR